MYNILHNILVIDGILVEE